MPRAPEQFVHLHNHTEYSLLDGASRIGAMVRRAAELEMPAIALTDHGVMYGAIHFYKECKQAGIKPILGCEVYVAPRSRHLREGRADRDPFHLTLLATDAQGYLNLMRLCTAGQMEGLYYKPRIDREILAEHSKGLVALSGCLAGEVATRLTAGDLDEARAAVAAHRDIFGKDHYLLEVQRHGMPEQVQVNEGLVKLAGEFGLRLCATNDLHYVHREDAEAHDVLLCLQTGASYRDPNRWRFGSQDFFLKSAAEMAAAFEDLPRALASTLEVAESAHLEIDLGHTLLPPFDVPDGLSSDSYLRKVAEEGLRWRYGEPTAEQKARLEDELDVITQTGYASYFLIVWDFYKFARQNGIVTGPGRGSAAGSLVSYCLGITNLDPIAHGLIFERFLNKDRVSMPDIDCDFSVEGREKVIRYVTEKYGADRVAQIITFTTMASKAAIRDVGRVLEVPLRDCDRLAKLVPVWQGRSKSLDDAIKEVPDFREAYESGEELKRLVDVARSLEGVSRNVSTHAAGVVIAPEPLVNYTPLQYGPGREAVITQYDMKAVQEVGLLKMDFLGLQNLDIISTCLRLIKENRGEEIDIDKIPFDDVKAYELMSAADTHGVFQLEGAGFRRMLVEMKPSRFEDVIVAIALFRPGPMQDIPAYVTRKHGREPIEYPHEWLEPILSSTYGIFTYQEQVMEAARVLAGFTLSEADILRAAMGKKDKVKMAQQRQKFIQGAVAKGIAESMAEQLFDRIAMFASYGFNKCVHGDTEVIDAVTGEQTTVRSLFQNPRPFFVHALGPDGRLRPRPVTDVAANGMKDVYEVATAQGKRIKTTLTHRFRSVGGWTPLSDLAPGDLIATPRSLPIAAEGTCAKELVGRGSSRKRLFRRSTIALLAQSLKSAELSAASTSDVFWDRIVTITPSGVADTYDLTVDEDHNFVANGMVVHNSHSAAYAVTTYQTAYLKANYPLEYMTSLLVHMEGNADKVATAIVDCRARNIEVLPPDINQSGPDFSIVGGDIRFGLAAVRNVGAKAVELIVGEREENGPFTSLQDLCDRVAGIQDVNRRVLESLVRCGACDALGERNLLLFNLERAAARAEAARRDRESGQVSLFGDVVPHDDVLEAAEPMPDEEKLRAEKELLGLYLSDHPLRRMASDLARLTDTQAVEVTSELQDNEVRVGGLVRDLRRVVTRKGQIMAYAQLEDLTGTIDVILFPRVYEQYRQLFEPERVLVVQGKVDARSGGARNGGGAQPDPEEEAAEAFEVASVVAESVWNWDDPDCAPVDRRQVVHIDVPAGDTATLDSVLAVLARHPGDAPVFIHVQLPDHQVTIQAGDRFQVAAGAALEADFETLFARRVTRLETVRPRVQANGNGRGQR